jgi:hypothetical protein
MGGFEGRLDGIDGCWALDVLRKFVPDMICR